MNIKEGGARAFRHNSIARRWVKRSTPRDIASDRIARDRDETRQLGQREKHVNKFKAIGS